MKKTLLFLSLTLIAMGCGGGTQQKQTDVDSSGVESVRVTINDHTYDYDVVSGATKEVKNTGNPIPYEEKLKQMFWSGKPAEGYIEGDYYHTDTVFAKGYTALIDVVKKDGKLVLVEFDEVGPKDYYAPEWAGRAKRLSGYGFFQAQSTRTDSSFMTLINGLTYLEHQMLSENRLTGEFKSVKGSSNSVRKAFMPAVERLAPATEKPSGKYYYGLAKKLSDGGIISRIQVVKEGSKIVSVKFDEIFEDTPEAIKDPKLQQFYRQSKYFSKDYPTVTGQDFKAFSDRIAADVISSQDLLKLSSEIEKNSAFQGELENYRTLAKELISHIK